ncbi:hypothetical protein ING2D1G_0736 [Peptoniphilus sp. ING2-D1G]|nr:hypothetical protein ING2D1G_0736 [Peptoniphilus sp. ING2-D1G]
MKIYKYDYEITNKYILNRFNGYTILDIETTGLSRNNDIIILIGTIYIQKHTTIRLLFAENLNEEIKLLKELNLNDQKIITYNGNSFDLPFVQSKKLFYKLTPDKFTSFDLYEYIKKYKYLLELDRIRQIDIEKYLNISRKDFISGKELILLYKEYLINNDNDILKQITAHNKDDLTGLLNCLIIVEKIEKLLTIVIEKNIFNITQIEFQKNRLIVTGNTNLNKNLELNKYNYNLKIYNNKFSIYIDILENYYDDLRKCKYILSGDFFGIENISNVESPEQVFILYLDKINFDNIKHLTNIILKEIFKL